MFCRNCGAPVAADQQFCANCGLGSSSQGSTPPQRNPRQKWWVILLILAAVFIIVLAEVNSPSTSSQSTGGSVQTQTYVSHQIGDNVGVGIWSYRVNGMRWANRIGSEYTQELPDAKFLILDLSIRNNDNSASTLPPLKLHDQQGREYDESSKAFLLEGSFGPLKSLNPGVSSRGTVVFDVPEGTYSLVVSGGFTSGESATIYLGGQ